MLCDVLLLWECAYVCVCVCFFKMCITYFRFGTLISVWICSISVTVVPFTHNWFTYCILKYMCISEEMCVWQSKYLHVGSSKWHSRWGLKGATQQGFVKWLQFALCRHQGLASVSALSFWILITAQKVQESSTLGLKMFRTHIGFVDGSRHIIVCCANLTSEC